MLSAEQQIDLNYRRSRAVYRSVKCTLIVGLFYCGYHASEEWRALRLEHQRNPSKPFSQVFKETLLNTLYGGSTGDGGIHTNGSTFTPLSARVEKAQRKVPSFWDALWRYVKEGEEALRPLTPTNIAYPITTKAAISSNGKFELFEVERPTGDCGTKLPFQISSTKPLAQIVKEFETNIHEPNYHARDTKVKLKVDNFGIS